MLVFLLLATLATVTALPIGAPSSPVVCPDREMWYACGACDATCLEQSVVCAAICRKGSCGCIQDHVREPKEHRCVPRNECPRNDAAELLPVPADLRSVPDQVHPVPAELRPVPDEIRPVGPIIVQAPVCPDKEMYFHCGACDRSCSGVQPNCPKLCQEKGSCGCIAGHVREAKGPRCIPETECNFGVGPAELRSVPDQLHPGGLADLRPVPGQLHPVPAELRPVPDQLHPGGLADLRPVPDQLHPVPAELRPVPDEIVPPVVQAKNHPQLCPDRERWFPCGACDGSCSEPTPVCHKMCQSRGSCGCIDNHVREPKGHGCIHVKNCPNTFIPLEIHE